VRNLPLILLALSGLALPVQHGHTAEAGQFPAPSLEGFVMYREYDDDGDGDGVKETHIQRYRNLAGDSLFSMTSHGHLWAWSLDSLESGDNSKAANYVIRDSNCNGVFDEVYGLDEQFHVPDCVKK